MSASLALRWPAWLALALLACRGPAEPPLEPLDYAQAARGEVGAPRRFSLPPGPTLVASSGDHADIALALHRPGGEVVVVDRWAAPSAGERWYVDVPEGAVLEVRRARPAATSTGTFSLTLRRASPDRVALDARIEAALADARAPDGERRRAAWPRLRALADEARAAGASHLAEVAALAAGRTAARVGDRAWQVILRELARTATRAIARAEAHLELSGQWAEAGFVRPAQRHLEAARREAPSDPRVRTIATLLEARIANESGRSVDAIALARDAARRAAAEGDPALLARIAGAEGTPLVVLGDREGALAAFERELEVAKAAGDPRLEGVAWHHLAMIRSNFDKDWEGALPMYERAAKLAEQVGNIEGLAYELDSLGEMTSTLKRPVAIEYHRRALELRRKVGGVRGEAQTLISYGSALTRLGRAQDALPQLEEGIEKMRAAGNWHWEAYGQFRLGRAYHHLERYAEAVAAARAALDIVESQRAQVATEEGRAELLDAVRWYFDLNVSAAGDAYAQAPDLHWVQEALRASERARARTLVELITELDLPHDAKVPAELRARAEAIGAEVRGLEAEQRLARAEHAPKARIEALEAEIVAKMAEYAKVRRAVQAADPRRAALLATPIVDLPAARALLEPDTVAVELYLGAGGAYAIVVGTSTGAVRALGPQGPLDEAARALHTNLSARNQRVPQETAAARAARIAAADAAAQEGLRTLRQDLFGGIEGALEGHQRVVVVPDGALHYVPFAALLPELEVVTAPSLSVLAALRARGAEARGQGLALVGDPVLDAEDPRLEVRGADAPDLRLPRLRFAGAEIDAIAALVPESQRVVRRGFEANRAWVLGGALASRRLVHFATHGLLDASEPARSGLVLSQLGPDGAPRDGFLSLADVYGLRLRADVVTLSACETALGKEVRSEGLVGLTRGLLHAGARQVVASLWKVHDQATRDLMVRFYRGLLDEGLAPAAALRAAQRALAASERFSAPYYWAGFVLQGDLQE